MVSIDSGNGQPRALEMELSIREAAVLMGRSARTVRALERFRRRVAAELAGAPGPIFERSAASSAGVVLF